MLVSVPLLQHKRERYYLTPKVQENKTNDFALFTALSFLFFIKYTIFFFLIINFLKKNNL